MALAAPRAFAGPLRASIIVDRYPTAASPNEIVRIPVRLLVQEGSGRPAAVGGAPLKVRTTRIGRLAEAPLLIPDVITDSGGRAVIAFRMPKKLRNNARREVATKVVVDLHFPGSGRIPPAEANRAIQIKIRP